MNRRFVVIAAAVAAVALAAAAFLFGRLSVESGSLPRPNAVDVGFSRDMAAHHQQAVLMSELLRERGADPELKAIAVDMVLTQTNQVGQMQGWLALWGEPFAVAEPPMRWMGGDHASHGADQPMTGMASQADLNELESLSGVEAERKYLELMIPHHQGGVEMAQHAVDHASTGAVSDLASSMLVSQQTEIETLEKFLSARRP